MAKAQAYNEWEDAGLTFSTDELEDWDPHEWAVERVRWFAFQHLVFVRRSYHVDCSNPAFCLKVRHYLRTRAVDYFRGMEISRTTVAPLEEASMPDDDTPEYKAIAVAAAKLDEITWLKEYGLDIETSMRHVVTIGRRASAQWAWKKSVDRQSNKLANCLKNEFTMVQKLENQF